MNSEQIYRSSPRWLQNTLVTLYGVYWKRLRFGGSYSGFVEGYAARDDYTAKDWNRWQTSALRTLLSVAAETPYYRAEIDPALLDSHAISGFRLTELQRFPLLEKQTVRARWDDLVAGGYHARKHTVFHTSGSTGTPIRAVSTREDIRRCMALREARACRWAGVSYTQPRATFSGRVVVPGERRGETYYRYNAMEMQYYFSVFHLSEKTVHEYATPFLAGKIVWINGYSYSISLLAALLENAGLRPVGVRAIITTSEKVQPEMRATMERVFGCKVYEEYGAVEDVFYVSTCEHGSMHINPDAGIIEVLRPDGSPAAPGEAGEVVATGFLRQAQPMIRYRIGDTIIMDETPCKCGRGMSVVREIVGRVEDAVVGPDGRKMVRFHGLFIGLPTIIEAQVVQKSLERLEVHVVNSGVLDAAVTAEIVRRVHERLTDRVRVDVLQVDRIPRGANGKYKAVVSGI